MILRPFLSLLLQRLVTSELMQLGKPSAVDYDTQRSISVVWYRLCLRQWLLQCRGDELEVRKAVVLQFQGQTLARSVFWMTRHASSMVITALSKTASLTPVWLPGLYCA